jgi:uncharacterized phiE125 gp8 family phage protein
MRKYAQSDLGYYSARYYDTLGNIVTPDWDATLYWQFRDSAGVLQFTATTTSTPALQVGTDGTGDYVYVDGLDLSAYDPGVVEVRKYAKTSTVETEPYPEISYAFEVISDDSLVDELRDLLHLDDGSQDGLLLSLIESAAEYAEKYLARSLLTQSRVKQVQAPVNRGLSQSILKVPSILLTYPPVQSITRVYTVDRYGTETDIDSDDYWLDDVSEPPELHLHSVTWSDKLRVEYTAGYGATYDDLPEAIKRGILLHAAYLFKYRGDCPDGEAAEKSGAISAYRILKVVRRG